VPSIARRSWESHFGPFGGEVWLNCAHQGPLPRAAVAAAQTAIRQKVSPSLIRDSDFTEVPRSLKRVLGSLIGVAPEEVILGNSASYGLHILRNGIGWKPADEVISTSNEFPATVYPWLGMEFQGVTVRLLTPLNGSLSPEDLEKEIRPNTRLVALSWVNSFTGSVLDVESIGRICRDRGILFVLNASQGLGAREFGELSRSVDAVVSTGSKWLCGPYGTGFAWIRRDIREGLRRVQSYWLPHAWGSDLTSFELKESQWSSDFDVFSTANFLNFLPWLASIKLLRRVGVARIQRHNEGLANSLLKEGSDLGFRSISPPEKRERSSIVVLSHPNSARNPLLFARLSARRIRASLRRGNLRFSPHLYNSSEQIGRVLSILRTVRTGRADAVKTR
jgi:cysteine desulfurase / selenocysteine lyase